MAGIALAINAIVDMPLLVNNFRAANLNLSPSVSASLSTTGYGGSIVIILFYVYFFIYCLFSGFTYYKASKSPTLNGSNLIRDTVS